MMLLDEVFPTWHVRERHATRVAADPGRAWRAVTEVTARDVPLLLVLMGIRSIPAFLLGRLPAVDLDAPLLGQFVRAGFLPLGERPGEELAIGVAGRFWRVTQTPKRFATPAAFAAFDEPASAKAVMNLRVEPDGAGGARVTTETRILGLSPTATRRFKLYWAVIGAGSALIRRAWLRAIRRRAENPQ